MFDFRLKVFYTVAMLESFTKASKELGISQPAVTKHIKEIENHFQVQLFIRGSSTITLTPSGQVLLNYAQKTLELYQGLEFDLKAISSPVQGVLHIGASRNISQYILSALLADFRYKYPDLSLESQSSSSSVIEHLLLDEKIDIGLVEKGSGNPQISYQDFLQDQIVLVCRVGNPYVEASVISISDLLKFSFLQSEPGCSIQQMVQDALKEHGVDMDQLKTEMRFSSTEGIKMYLTHSNSFAFVSKFSILKELKYNELQILEIANFTISRPLQIILNKNKENPGAKVFANFALFYDL